MGALCAQVVLAAIMLARFGAGERGTDFALQATARGLKCALINQPFEVPICGRDWRFS